MLSFKNYMLLAEELLGQKAERRNLILKQFSAKWEGLPGYQDLDEFVDKLGEIDPTKAGTSMLWLARLAIKSPNENRVEDLERVAKDLKTFDDNKTKIVNKDINSYKSFQELYLAVEQFYKKRVKTASEKAADREDAKLAAVKEQITIVYKGSEGWIRIPKTKKAAQFLGQSTRWCTSAKSSNMFDSYSSRDSLFVIYDKSTGKRFQLHVQDGQYADDKDTMIGLKAVPDWAWNPIIDWYKQNNPKMSMKQLTTLGAHTDENLAKGTDHEDVMDLMKQYGIM